MFWTNLFRKTGYFQNPFRDLFIEEFEKAGGPPATGDKLLLEVFGVAPPGSGALLLENGFYLLLE
jgi:hypothetical protein